MVKIGLQAGLRTPKLAQESRKTMRETFSAASASYFVPKLGWTLLELGGSRNWRCFDGTTFCRAVLWFC